MCIIGEAIFNSLAWKATLDNVNKFTKMLSDNSASMGKTFSNLETITDSLAAADIYSSVMNLKTSLENASVMIDNLNNGKGTAGQLLTNDSLYTNLNNSLVSLNQTLGKLGYTSEYYFGGNLNFGNIKQYFKNHFKRQIKINPAIKN